MKILLVDDEPDFVADIKDKLAAKAWEVVTASNRS